MDLTALYANVMQGRAAIPEPRMIEGASVCAYAIVGFSIASRSARIVGRGAFLVSGTAALHGVRLASSLRHERIAMLCHARLAEVSGVRRRASGSYARGKRWCNSAELNFEKLVSGHRRAILEFSRASIIQNTQQCLAEATLPRLTAVARIMRSADKSGVA